ncbi:MAG: type II toxin-antitoxin system VapC family toxin [Terriglobia bacterium]
MTTAIDTNVIVALWDRDTGLNSAAQSALDAALGRGSLIVSAPVFAELMACPGRDQAFLDMFFQDAGISIDWNLDEAIWRAAGRAFQVYAVRRRRHGEGPRRILADFVIGAHAIKKGYCLLTLDDRLYQAAFPGLEIVRI